MPSGPGGSGSHCVAGSKCSIAHAARRFSQEKQARFASQNEGGSSYLKVISGGPPFVALVKTADQGPFDHRPDFR